MYTNIRKKLNKFADGGMLPKLSKGGLFTDPNTLEYWTEMGLENSKALLKLSLYQAGAVDENGSLIPAKSETSPLKVSTNTNSNFALMSQTGEIKVNQEGVDSAMDSIKENMSDSDSSGIGGAFASAGKELVSGLGKQFGKGGESGATAFNAGIDALSKGDAKGAIAGMVGGAGVMAVNAVDTLAMGDKNFGAQSEAIDGAVHGVSGALMKTGNPYAIAAGAALEGVNFLTKAGGLTVQGFDVDINSSGYGNIGHMESSSSRDFGAMIGLGGLNRKRMQNKLARRNEQARMALNAAEISEDSSFEQEARMNSVENTIMNNQIALAGGLETNLLGG